jgi:predicted nucleic acid-binding protein
LTLRRQVGTAVLNVDAPLLDRVWELRDAVSAYDAMYLALAESLECALVTADARLGRAAGVRCPVTVVPN